jgi:hypothetical protein
VKATCQRKRLLNTLLKVEPFHAGRVPVWMNSLKYTASNNFPTFVATKKERTALSFARDARIRREPRPRFLQHIGGTAKKCQFLAPRSLDSEATAAFTPLKARPGSAKAFGFPPARDLTVFGTHRTGT